jgi:hypothetical protein
MPSCVIEGSNQPNIRSEWLELKAAAVTGSKRRQKQRVGMMDGSVQHNAGAAALCAGWEAAAAAAAGYSFCCQ